MLEKERKKRIEREKELNDENCQSSNRHQYNKKKKSYGLIGRTDKVHERPLVRLFGRKNNKKSNVYIHRVVLNQ